MISSNTRITWHDFAPVVSGKKWWFKSYAVEISWRALGSFLDICFFKSVWWVYTYSFQDLVLAARWISCVAMVSHNLKEIWSLQDLEIRSLLRLWNCWNHKYSGLRSWWLLTWRRLFFFVGPNWLGCMWIVGKEADNEGFEMFFPDFCPWWGYCREFASPEKRIHFLAISKRCLVLLRISTGQFHACPVSLSLECDFSALGSRWRS